MGLEINGLNTNQATTKQTKGSQQVTNQGGKSAGSKAAQSDASTIVISDEAKSLSQLQSEVSNGSAINESKVAELKAAIAEGSYKPDAERIAGKIMDIDSQF